MLRLQIHELDRKHHIVVQICHDQKRSDDDKGNQIFEVNTLNRSRARRLVRKLSSALRALGRLAGDRNDCSWPLTDILTRAANVRRG
jgi:hypothetical protein